MAKAQKINHFFLSHGFLMLSETSRGSSKSIQKKISQIKHALKFSYMKLLFTFIAKIKQNTINKFRHCLLFRESSGYCPIYLEKPTKSPRT